MPRQPTPQPTSDELVTEWYRLMLLQEAGDGLGGSLGERCCRAVDRERRLRNIEWLLCERMWAAPVVDEP